MAKKDKTGNWIDPRGKVVPEKVEDFIHDKYGWCYYLIEPKKNPLIFNLYVSPQYRNHGHSRRYLQYVIGRIRENGYKGEIEIEAKPKEKSVDRSKLALFYRKMGLKVIDIQHSINPTNLK